MSHWTVIASWVFINIAIGIFAPVIIWTPFMCYTKPKPIITLRRFYAKGELGLASLISALGVIVDVTQSHNLEQSLMMLILNLSAFALASAYVWAVPLCNDLLLASIQSNNQ